MGSFDSVLTWLVLSLLQVKTLVLLGCTVLVLSAVFGIWYILFKMTGSEIRRNFGEFPSTKETITSWNIEVRDSEGKLVQKEGPFYNWDEAVAKCVELNAKHS